MFKYCFTCYLNRLGKLMKKRRHFSARKRRSQTLNRWCPEKTGAPPPETTRNTTSPFSSFKARKKPFCFGKHSHEI